jgi:hypothetical protein
MMVTTRVMPSAVIAGRHFDVAAIFVAPFAAVSKAVSVRDVGDVIHKFVGCDRAPQLRKVTGAAPMMFGVPHMTARQASNLADPVALLRVDKHSNAEVGWALYFVYEGLKLLLEFCGNRGGTAVRNMNLCKAGAIAVGVDGMRVPD